MRTLRLVGGRELTRKRQQAAYFNPLRTYVSYWRPESLRCGDDGKPLLVKDPPPAPRVILTPESLRRHNTLQPALQSTHRLMLRWGESGGNGLPNPEAEVRELHYDPLPPDLQEKVDTIVTASPWELLVRKWYRTTLTGRELAHVLGLSKTQLYVDWNASLWYYRGRFESERVYD